MQAGAKALVISLWKVPDQSTVEIMEYFYRFLAHGESRAGALRRAQMLVRKKYPEPLHWGAFILQGEAGRMSAPLNR